MALSLRLRISAALSFSELPPQSLHSLLGKTEKCGETEAGRGEPRRSSPLLSLPFPVLLSHPVRATSSRQGKARLRKGPGSGVRTLRWDKRPLEKKKEKGIIIEPLSRDRHTGSLQGYGAGITSVLQMRTGAQSRYSPCSSSEQKGPKSGLALGFRYSKACAFSPKLPPCLCHEPLGQGSLCT